MNPAIADTGTFEDTPPRGLQTLYMTALARRRGKHPVRIGISRLLTVSEQTDDGGNREHVERFAILGFHARNLPR